MKMLMGAKHFWNPHESTFIKFLDHSEGKWLWKYLLYWNFKSEGVLLTHWLSMTSTLFGIVRIWSSLFNYSYHKNKKIFLHFLFHLWNLHQILNIFEKKMFLIANVFPKLQNVKSLLKPLSRKRCFRTSYTSGGVNGCQRLLKFALEHLYHIFWSLWEEVISKISPLFKFEILGVFANSLTADDKYPVRDCENL